MSNIHRRAGQGLGCVLAFCIGLTWLTPTAHACGGLSPGESAPRHRETVELGTAVAVYGITAGVTAVGAPLAAWALDKRDQFPLYAAVGTSVASGFVGWAAASLASIALDDGGECGSSSELHAEKVVLLDLLPLSLAAAPTLVAWTLSEASTRPPGATRAQVGIGALADARHHLILFARLEL